jgi:hypothetical protein
VPEPDRVNIKYFIIPHDYHRLLMSTGENGEGVFHRGAALLLLIAAVVASGFIAGCTGGSTTNGGGTTSQLPLQVSVEKNITLVPLSSGFAPRGLVPHYAVYVVITNTGSTPISSRDFSVKVTRIEPPPASYSSRLNFDPPPTLQPGATYRYTPWDINTNYLGICTQEEKYSVDVHTYSLQNNQMIDVVAYSSELTVSPKDYKNPEYYRNTGLDGAQLQKYIADIGDYP